MENLMRAIARDIDADIAATDVSRVLRVPGFWNRKPQRNNTVDIVFSRDHAVSYKSLSSSFHLDSDFSSRQETPPSTQEEERVLESSFDGKLPQEKKLSSSERDWYLIHRWLALGVSPDECRKRIISRRRGQKRNVAYYARYSVQKAVRIRAENQSEKSCITQPEKVT